jgi:hypothetical protein
MRQPVRCPPGPRRQCLARGRSTHRQEELVRPHHRDCRSANCVPKCGSGDYVSQLYDAFIKRNPTSFNILCVAQDALMATLAAGDFQRMGSRDASTRRNPAPRPAARKSRSAPGCEARRD